MHIALREGDLDPCLFEGAADGEAELALDAQAVPRLRPGAELEVERAVAEAQEEALGLGMFQDLGVFGSDVGQSFATVSGSLS